MHDRVVILVPIIVEKYEDRSIGPFSTRLSQLHPFQFNTFLLSLNFYLFLF